MCSPGIIFDAVLRTLYLYLPMTEPKYGTQMNILQLQSNEEEKTENDESLLKQKINFDLH